MPIFRDKLHLGRKVPQMQTDDYSDQSVTSRKIASNAISKEKLSEDVKQEFVNLRKSINDIDEHLDELVEGIVERIIDNVLDNAGTRYAINVDMDGFGAISLGETIHCKFEVWGGWNNPIDRKMYDVKWKIERLCDSFASPALDPWNNSEKAKSFDGEIGITWSRDAGKNDLDPNELNEATRFKITASIYRNGTMEDELDTQLIM